MAADNPPGRYRAGSGGPQGCTSCAPFRPTGVICLARGTVIYWGRSMAVGTSEVFDADGKKVAVATGSAVILPGRPATVTTELALPRLDESEDDDERP